MLFYNELQGNILLKDFLREKTLSRVFVPVATYHEDHKAQDDEFVAIIEGVTFPFFGISYSIHKTQYNFDLNVESHIDHSKEAVALAQKFANLFVDEARLNGNFFVSRREEAKALISNYDTMLTEVAEGENADIFKELYLF